MSRAPQHCPRRAFVEQIMGLPISVHVRGPAAGSPAVEAAVATAFAQLRRTDALFSTYDPASEISRIDAGTLDLADADPLVHEVLALSEQARRLTGGLFDVHLPDPAGRYRLDPSGIVKSWAAQRAFTLLAVDDLDICLNAGGDVVVATGTGGQPWRIGIENPDAPATLIGVLQRSHGGVATSGSRARGNHLIDPRDGSRPQELRQVSIAGPCLVRADVLATAGFVHGPGVVDWLGQFPGYEAVVVSADGRVTTTPGVSEPALRSA
jgi:thiamine biosynthesis lipoprotein